MEAFLAERERRRAEGDHSSDEDQPGSDAHPRFPKERCCPSWPHDRKWTGCVKPSRLTTNIIGIIKSVGPLEWRKLTIYLWLPDEDREIPLVITNLMGDQIERLRSECCRLMYQGCLVRTQWRDGGTVFMGVAPVTD